MFIPSCAYGFAFESIVPKNNQVLSGRDRISHPVIMETEPFHEVTADALTFSLIFLGKAITYLPYFYYALQNSGKSGIVKERVRFTIQEVRDGSRSLLINENTLDTGFEPDLWEYEPKHPQNRDLRNCWFSLPLLCGLRWTAGTPISSAPATLPCACTGGRKPSVPSTALMIQAPVQQTAAQRNTAFQGDGT
jgi:hypothetical protein